MTEKEVHDVENRFAMSLPVQYRTILLDYPFPEESWANELAMPNDRNLLIDMNHDRSILKEYGIADPSLYFQIGSDGGELTYYIALNDPQCIIYTADLETGEFSQHLPFDKWCEELRSIDQEIKRDQAEMARKKWWQIWR